MKKLIIFLIILIVAGLVAGFFILKHQQKPPLSSAIHYSYFSQPQFFDEAYKTAKSNTKIAQPISAIIVNHHLLAANFIAEEFNLVATDAPITVLLVSPNHFDAGKAAVITSSAVWKTPYGEILPDTKLIHQLASENLASIEESPFEQEHGISGIVAFIKKSLPNAKIVPVIFNNRIKSANALSLGNNFSKILPQNILVVGSFDFSHYLPSNAADFHDADNLEAVQNFDLEKIYHLDIDSRPGLLFFLEFLKDRGQENFHLLENSNSAKLVHQDILETTSYVDGYFTQGPASTSAAATLLSVPSTIISDENVSELNKHSPEYALTYLERLFYGQDYSLAFSSTTSTIFQKLGITTVDSPKIERQVGSAKVILMDCTKKALSARSEIDNGAYAVICQNATKNYLEFYKNKPIIYASGNLFGKSSLAVGLAVKDKDLQIYLLPIGRDGNDLKLLIAPKSVTVWAEMANNSQVSPDIKNQIKKGIITIKNFK